MYWQLLRGSVHHLKVHLQKNVSIVAGPIIVQRTVSLSIQRNWLIFVHVVWLVRLEVVVLVLLLEAQCLLLLLHISVLLSFLGFLIQGLLFM
jgi:hypothetical protein